MVETFKVGRYEDDPSDPLVTGTRTPWYVYRWILKPFLWPFSVIARWRFGLRVFRRGWKHRVHNTLILRQAVKKAIEGGCATVHLPAGVIRVQIDDGPLAVVPDGIGIEKLTVKGHGAGSELRCIPKEKAKS